MDTTTAQRSAALSANTLRTRKGSLESQQRVKNIHEEYTVTRNLFYPGTSSPNLFLRKLRARMKIYYNDLYSCPNRSMK